MKTKTFLAALAAMWLGSALVEAQVTVTSVITNGLAEPYNIVTDDDNNFVISDSVNNRIVWVDAASGAGSTLAGIPEDFPGSDNGPPYLAHFFNPQGLALATVGGDAGVIVADTGNHTLRFVRLLDGYVSTLAGVAGVQGSTDGGPGVALLNNPLGLACDGTNTLYIADSGNNGIRILNLASGTLSTLVVSGTTFNMPAAVALGAPGKLWVADTRNHQVKLLNLTSATTASLVSALGSGVGGSRDSTFGLTAQLNGPRGLLWRSERSQLLISDTGNHTIRMATNNLTYGTTNYAVATFAGTPGLNGFANGLALLSKFDTPVGLALDHEVNGFLIADLKNNAIRRIQDGPALPAVASPQIGWVNFVWSDALGTYVTFLETGQPRIFNNDVQFAIKVENNTQCHYTTTNTAWPPGFADDGPNPSKIFGSTPPEYHDNVPKYIFDQNPAVIQIERNANLGGLVIKAMGYMIGRPSSAVVKANYAFIVADPTIIGNNLASFRVTTVTTNPPAALYYTVGYTVQGTPEPTETSSLVPQGGQITGLTFPQNQTNVTIKVRAFAPNYLPSQTITKVFSRDNFIPNRITFGLTNGEPSSSFIARPGQYFYAPVTLQLQPEGETMYSLQFNVAVTNGLTNLDTGFRPPEITNAAGIDFFSMLMSQVIPSEGTYYPPADGKWYLTIPPFIYQSYLIITTNASGIVETNAVTTPSHRSIFTNANNNLLGVGWFYRTGFKYWFFGDPTGQSDIDFDTTKQDLIQFSIAHDTLFNKGNGVVVVGAYSFQVPNAATNGDQYLIQLGSPSATRDGVGAPGAAVFIQAPTVSQPVTVGAPSYVVGDAAPFHWLNAGDFGNGNLLNDDVMQVYQAAILNVDMPPVNSDLFRAMDSCGRFGRFDTNNNYFVDDGPMNSAELQAMFDGSNDMINCVVFGDDPPYLDVCDLFVTFRRSLDPSLAWFRRYWADGKLVAVQTTNLAFNTLLPTSYVAVCSSTIPLGAPNPAYSYQQSSISFKAGDAVASAAQTIQIPITAQTSGKYPLRVLSLNLTVVPLDGSPSLTQPVQFVPAADLGQPTIASSKDGANYSAAWLDNTIAGVSNTAVLGTLTVTLPAGAPATAAYAIHFDHASASPNGIASFPKRTRTGLITSSDRSASSWGDGIPDSWRLRYFGTLNNLLSAATADADGDGHSNWQEFLAGTDPNDSQSVLKLLSKTAGTGASKAFVVRWPSVAAKHYVIERSSSPFGPNWLPAGTATGTGWDMEFTDPDTSTSARFYRVRVTE
jgi:hypothetical protein